MEHNLIELTSRRDIFRTYNIYKYCLFRPTKAKFNQKINAFLNDNSVKVFACSYCDKIKGVIVISFTAKCDVEILGIAVDISARNQGIGSFMINKLVNEYSLSSVYAETDHDAVDFYRKNHFRITKFSETFDRETVLRYKCELVK